MTFFQNPLRAPRTVEEMDALIHQMVQKLHRLGAEEAARFEKARIPSTVFFDVATGGLVRYLSWVMARRPDAQSSDLADRMCEFLRQSFEQEIADVRKPGGGGS